MFGTSFTRRPRATAGDLAPIGGRAAAADILLGRLDDLIGALASAGSNERLQFARDVLERRGIHPTTPAGREQARTYLIELHERMIGENDRYRRSAEDASRITDETARQAAFANVFNDRGLSSDTSLPIDFALDETLSAAKSQGQLTGRVRRLAIIGPGLDFTDKADGYDFYPPQTIQPFALVDSLLRLGLAVPEDLRVTAFDLSARVSQHIDAARARAERGVPYTLHLPITRNDPAHEWAPGFVAYWQRCGNAIGDAGTNVAPPDGPTRVSVRAIDVRPAIVLTITTRDLNVVVERPAMRDEGDRFDIVVATNVLVYYDAFEQALALQNISSMLRPGGFLLANTALWPAGNVAVTRSFETTTYWDRQRHFDTLFWYRRK
jgi:SAM-dependent methyltransferase